MSAESKTDLYRKGLLAIGGIAPVSKPWKDLLDRLQEAAADDDLTVILNGETGTGKTMLAQGVHNASRRAKKPFVHFDVSSEEPTTLRGTLFGHEEEAYTGADSRTDGAFQAAKGGTLFLDEITDLSWDLQGSLRHAVDYQQVRRIGGAKLESVDVRIVCATNVPLEDVARDEKRWRKDLFMRLKQAVFRVPSLREVPEEIPGLVASMVEAWCISRKREPVEVHPRALATLMEHPWPGNVRELKNAVRSGLARQRNCVLRSSDLRLGEGALTLPIDRRTLRERSDQWAYQVWLSCDRCWKAAAAILDIHEATLHDCVDRWTARCTPDRRSEATDAGDEGAQP